jgi:MFS family permease
MATEGQSADDGIDVLNPFRQFFALRRDVLVLSLAMFAFSLAFQMTGRYVPEFMRALGASAGIVGLYGSLGNLIGAVYPYPGGALSDRLGSRLSLTLFGVASTLGFVVWLLAPAVGTVAIGPVALPAWVWVFVGLVLSQAWKSFGLGATFAIVKQSVSNDRLAAGFASTETFRRVGFLVGPLIAAGVLASTTDFVTGFQWVLVVAVGFGVVATVAQHLLYDASEDTIGKEFAGVSEVREDLRALPSPLRPLLVADTLIRFANGMVYAFFVFVVIDRGVGLDVAAFGRSLELGPGAYFGLLLGVEMTVALLSMVPVARLAERTGLKPVVGLGFAVYAFFPAMLVLAPTDPFVYAALFAFSGLRFAGLPAHKALIVGPAEADAGGRVTGTYYLVRNVVVIPSTAIGGALYGVSALGVDLPALGDFTLTGPGLAFGAATAVGLVGVAYFFAFGEEFAAYA